MDRRTFLTGAGTLGIAAATAGGGWVVVDRRASGLRADNLAKAAGAGAGARTKAGAVAGSLADGVTVGFLLDSDLLMDYEASGWSSDSFAAQMRWAPWQPSLARGFARDVSITLGRLQPAQYGALPGLLNSLEVVAFFATDPVAQVASFSALKHEVESSSKRTVTTSPVRFGAPMLDRTALQVSYRVDGPGLAPGMNTAGSVYLPLGGREGLGTGLYVLAGPSRVTGAAPNLAAYAFTGSMQAPLSPLGSHAVDFDHVVMAIRPKKA